MFIKRKKYEELQSEYDKLQRDYQRILTDHSNLSKRDEFMQREFYISKCVLKTIPQSMLVAADSTHIFYLIKNNLDRPYFYGQEEIPFCNQLKHEVVAYDYPLITLNRLSNDEKPVKLGTVTYNVEEDVWSEKWDVAEGFEANNKEE